MEEDKVVVAVCEDAGEVVGFREEEAVGVVGGGDWGELAAELESGGDAEAKVVEILPAGEIGGRRDEAGGDLRGGGVDGGAERFAGGGEGDESARGGFGVLFGFEVGAVDPEVAGVEAVGGAASDAEGGHEAQANSGTVRLRSWARAATTRLWSSRWGRPETTMEPMGPVPVR